MNCTLSPGRRFAVVLLALAMGSRAFGAVDPPAIHRPAAARQFSNPIISGFASDPSVVRVGDDFYLVNSTFEYYPGIPVYHSRDLVNWSLIGHAMNDAGFGGLSHTVSSDGIQAATIRYHAGLYYIVATSIVDDQWVSFVVTAQDPKGPWSAPHIIKDAIGIDPSLFFDEDGRAWYTANGARMVPTSPDETGIWIQEFDPRTLELTGPRHFVWNGCCGGVTTEGPHLYKRGGTYYLLVAEGGTGFEHSVSVATAQSVQGPYTGVPRNPVLTNRHLGYGFPITGVGHADLVDLPDGRWYAVALGWRSLDGDHAMLGRETFLVPVSWETERERWRDPRPDYPVFSPGSGRMDLHYPMPFRGTRQQSQRAFHDDFQSTPLGPEWNFRRPPEQEFASLLDSPGALTLRLQPGRLSERGQYSFVGIRQRDFQFETTVDVQFRPTTMGEESGLVVLQNDRAAYLLTLGLAGGAGSDSAVQLQVKSLLHGQWSRLAAAPVQRDTVHLKVVGDYLGYQFQYSVDGHRWLSLGPLLDSIELSPGRLPGFNYTGVNIGLYASSNGEPSTHQALFRAFRYTPRGRDRDDWFRISSQGSMPANQ